MKRSDPRRPVAALATLLALALPAIPACAQGRPVFPPTRDVAVTYRLDTTQKGTPDSVLVRYSVAADRLRVDGGLPGYVLVDGRSRHATIVMEQMGLMMDAPPRAGVEQAFVLENAARFTRRGGATVAGLRCTIWDVAGDSATGSACVTTDGVVLRANGHDRHGRAASLEATRVEYGVQNQALFYPPPNVRQLDLAGPAGGGQGGLSGLLSSPAAAALLDKLRAPRQP